MEITQPVISIFEALSLDLHMPQGMNFEISVGSPELEDVEDLIVARATGVDGVNDGK